MKCHVASARDVSWICSPGCARWSNTWTERNKARVLRDIKSPDAKAVSFTRSHSCRSKIAWDVCW